MYKADEIAIWFLYNHKAEQNSNIAEGDEYEIYDDITHLKLQKLLYNAQGVHLAITGRPLFEENIVAWSHGPVVKEIYTKYLCFGRNPISFESNIENNEKFRKINNDNETVKILNLVYSNFIIYTAWQLRNMSHAKDSPWDKTPNNSIISNEIIKKYFEEEVME